MYRSVISDADIDEVCRIVRQWMASRLEKHGRGAFVSPHEILGVVAEEYDELLEAVRKDSVSLVMAELTDVAVACLFGLASLRHAYEKKEQVADEH